MSAPPLGYKGFDLSMNSKTIKIENFASMSMEKRNLVWTWRNSDRIRLKMTDTGIIPLENHLKFVERLAGRDDKMYLLFSIDDEPFGVLDFVNCDRTAKTCETGLYIGDERFLGLGFLLYYYNFYMAFEHFDFETIHSSILKSNKGAVALTTKMFGLKIVGETEYAYLVRYAKSDWMGLSSTFKHKILDNAHIGRTEWVRG